MARWGLDKIAGWGYDPEDPLGVLPELLEQQHLFRVAQGLTTATAHAATPPSGTAAFELIDYASNTATLKAYGREVAEAAGTS